MVQTEYRFGHGTIVTVNGYGGYFLAARDGTRSRVCIGCILVAEVVSEHAFHVPCVISYCFLRTGTLYRTGMGIRLRTTAAPARSRIPISWIRRTVTPGWAYPFLLRHVSWSPLQDEEGKTMGGKTTSSCSRSENP